MTYRDLPIHQRINAKGNKVSFSPKIETLQGNLLKRVVRSNVDVEGLYPQTALYSLQVKHNDYDLPFNYNPHA